MSTPFETVSVERTDLGVVVAVALPPGKEPVPAEVLDRLPPQEREIASGLRGYRGPEWVGGRLALRIAAREALGIELGPVGIGPRKEPLLPPGVAGSVSHKRGVAMAIVGPVESGTLGIDVEDPGPERVGIERIVLGANELSALPATDRWPAVLARFAVKEALYKALHPYLNRYVGFSEASVSLAGGAPTVTLRLAHGEGPFSVEAHLGQLHDWLLALVRVTRGR